MTDVAASNPTPAATSLNIADNLVRTAERQPADVAIRLDDFELTWA